MQSRFKEFQNIRGVVGTTVASLFLPIVAAVNLYAPRRKWLAFFRTRRGQKIDDENLNALLSSRGFLSRIFHAMYRIVSRSWHMYPIGFLFGLGFDTATEIGLLGISAAQVARGTPFWTILVFPALSTAGMPLIDTTDSLLMTRAYGWAVVNPVRKLWYNLIVTAASVLIAISIGGIETLDLDRGFGGVVDNMNRNLGNLGHAAVGVFIAGRMVATVMYRAQTSRGAIWLSKPAANHSMLGQ